MTSKNDGGRARRGSSDKRRAITTAARKVFGRDGYARAGIDTIATEADVSTRTIYNHFEGKEQLFFAVIEDSATRVADSQTDMIDRHLGEVHDLESDLVALGREWVTIPTRDFADHFAMVRQINAEAAHFPQAALDAWQEAGPRRVQHALADAFARLDATGLLRVDDPRRAAHHFALLVGAEISERTFHGAVPLGEDEVSAIVIDGVAAFLDGYRARGN